MCAHKCVCLCVCVCVSVCVCVCLMPMPSCSVQSERPDTITGVLCGSLCIADEAIRKRFADYQAYLER